MNTVVCKFQGCGFRSKSGFCLNRLLMINNQGVCEYLTKPGWDQPVTEDYLKSTYRPPRKDWEEQKEEILMIEEQEKKGPTVEELLSGYENGKDGPPR